MSLDIERLRLRLPAALAPRAQGIARAVADALAGLQPTAMLRLAHLQLPALRVDAAASDVQIAAQIAASVAGQLRQGDRAAAAGEARS